MGYCRPVSALALSEVHKTLGATLSSVNGMEVVADYGVVAPEAEALRQSVGVVDLSFRGRLCLTGADRSRLLHGQVTNDVQKLQPGQGTYAALVTAKGRLESDLNIYALDNELLLDFEPGLSAKIIARLDHYIVADDVQVIDVAPHYGLLSFQGPRCGEVIQALDLAPALPAQPFGSRHIANPTLGDLYLVNRPRCAWPDPAPAIAGCDLYVPTDALAMVFDKAVAAAKAVGGRAVGFTALDHVRIEAGIPRFGADLDESNLAPEGGETFIRQAISYAKGCYIGQEVIARIRTYGQVTRALRGLRFLDEVPEMVPRGSKVLKDGKEVGLVTTGFVSASRNAVIALGFVRKECNAIGTELGVGVNGVTRPVRIEALPFAA